MYNIVIMGPQGCGKGTQGERLAEKLGIPNVSTGKLFRAEVELNTGLGRDMAGFMQRGERVPSDIVYQVMTLRLSEQDVAEGVILDGYPRTLEQGESLDEILTKLDRHLSHVVYLDISDDEAVRRLSGRRICSNQKCELNYHVEFNPPKQDPDHCDRCGSPLRQRTDDVPDAIRRRLEIYHRDTEPLVDFYAQRGILRRVDGAQQIDKVQQAVYDAVTK